MFGVGVVVVTVMVEGEVSQPNGVGTLHGTAICEIALLWVVRFMPPKTVFTGELSVFMFTDAKSSTFATRNMPLASVFVDAGLKPPAPLLYVWSK